MFTWVPSGRVSTPWDGSLNMIERVPAVTRVGLLYVPNSACPPVARNQFPAYVEPFMLPIEASQVGFPEASERNPAMKTPVPVPPPYSIKNPSPLKLGSHHHPDCGITVCVDCTVTVNGTDASCVPLS